MLVCQGISYLNLNPLIARGVSPLPPPLLPQIHCQLFAMKSEEGREERGDW